MKRNLGMTSSKRITFGGYGLCSLLRQSSNHAGKISVLGNLLKSDEPHSRYRLHFTHAHNGNKNKPLKILYL